jgi:hypothetical protein
VSRLVGMLESTKEEKTEGKSGSHLEHSLVLLLDEVGDEASHLIRKRSQDSKGGWGVSILHPASISILSLSI